MRIPLGSIWQAVRRVALVEEQIKTMAQAIEKGQSERQQLQDRLDAKIEREIERERTDRQRAEDTTANALRRLEERVSSAEDRLTRLEVSRDGHETNINATLNNLRGEVMLRMAQLQTAQSNIQALPEADEENNK